MTGAQRVAMWANMPRMRAQQMLNDGKTSGMNYGSLYDLVMLATGGDVEQAEEAVRQRMLAKQEEIMNGGGR